MARLTRRQFVGTSLGVAAAATGVGVAGASRVAGPLSMGALASSAQRSSNSAPMIVYVDQGGNGRLHVMVGDRQVVIQDHDMVNRLVAATA